MSVPARLITFALVVTALVALADGAVLLLAATVAVPFLALGAAYAISRAWPDSPRPPARRRRG
jgi:hypothetical protein